MKRVILSGIMLIFLIGLWMCAGTEKSLEMTGAVKEEAFIALETEAGQEDSEMKFSSSVIEEKTREILNKPEGVIMKSDLLEITEFEIRDCEEDIKEPFLDLQWYRNLVKVELEWCGVRSLAGAEELKELRELSLRDNHITDIEPVKNLTDLVSFSCAGNPVEDYSPLSRLVNLQSLQIGGHAVYDIGQTHFLTLTDADLAPIANLTKLKSLYAPWSGITSISALANLTQIEYLNLHNNRISDISILKGLGKLDYLELGQNEISDITPLYGLTNLTHIGLNDNQIPDDMLDRFFEIQKGESFTVTQSGRLREDMPEFTFLLEAHFDLKTGNYAVDSIAVYNGDMLLQTISIPELTLYGQTRTNEDKIDTLGFELEDLNFDGYQDIRLYDTFAGNSSQEWIYLVWDPELGIFESDERLKQIPDASFDQEKKLIYGGVRGSASSYYASMYQYIDGEIVEIGRRGEEDLFRTQEQIAHYFELASAEVDAAILLVQHNYVMERKEETGELETVFEEYILCAYDEEKNIEEEIHVEADSDLGRLIGEDKSK